MVILEIAREDTIDTHCWRFKRLRSDALDLGARVFARKRDRRGPDRVARPSSRMIDNWAVVIAGAAAAGKSAAWRRQAGDATRTQGEVGS